MPLGPNRAKAAAADQYPKLNAILNQIERASHALELEDGRYAYGKYLAPIYAYYWKSKSKGKKKAKQEPNLRAPRT